ncbi:hypothetical protein BH20ACT15_BH20ACT15_07290 [soil metagenome]
MDEKAENEGIRDRISGRGEDALGEVTQILLDNPLLHQALQVAVEARDRATQASASAMRSLNVPVATDVDRLGRRLRALSERLEAVEDELDRLARAVSESTKASGPDRGFESPPPPPQAPPGEPPRS